ncbi:MAG: hypothetical protein Q9214_003914 [Letrouitia sp. 1 TL-2023]
MPSIFVASAIVGFTSFAFTFFTFLRVFWESIRTMWNAHREIKPVMDNLRTELYGERAYFKNALKQARSKSKNSTRYAPEIQPLVILNDGIKGLMREFRELEEPFLDRPEEAEDLDIEKSGRVSLRGNYASMDLWRRFTWLHKKDDVVNLGTMTNRIQSRRIAYETSNTLDSVRKIQQHLEDLDDRIYALEEHFLGERLSDGKIYVRRQYRER